MSDEMSKHVCTYENCNKTFSKPSRLTTHIRSHTGECPYACNVEGCDKRYKRSDNLQRHKQMSHGIDVHKDVCAADSPLPCYRCDYDGCQATFTSHDNLQKHINRTHELKTYKCPYIGCHEEFKKHHQLTDHKLQHSKPNPYCCTEPGCGKSFPFPNKLKRHMKTHEGYVCSEEGCGERFDKWTLLVKHNTLKHKPEYECSICKKTFRNKQWLKQHTLTHSDSREVFICNHDNCGKEYLNLRNLNSHIRCYHEGKRFPCEHGGCGQTFASKQKQQLHMKMHDPNRPMPKKKIRKRVSLATKLTGVAMETEVRGQNEDHILNSPSADDRIPELHVTVNESSDSDHDKVVIKKFRFDSGIEVDITENKKGVKIIVQETSNSDIVSINKSEDIDEGNEIETECNNYELNVEKDVLNNYEMKDIKLTNFTAIKNKKLEECNIEEENS